MISWGWRNRRSYGLRDYAPRWLRPISAAVPWLTVGLLFQMICFLGGTLTTSEGLLFALPEEGHAGLVEQKDLEEASLVALPLPTPSRREGRRVEGKKKKGREGRRKGRREERGKKRHW